MSKLAVLRQYQYSPAAGGLFSFLAPVAKFIGKGLGIIKSPAVVSAAKAVLPAAATGAAYVAAEKLLAGKPAGLGARGATGSWAHRRGRGITARELRGYRKVSRLLHREGMVSKRARGRK